MKLRRDAWLILMLAVVALVFGAWLVLNRPGAGIAAFEREAKARAERARPKPAAASEFRATICAASPCVMVEAGGLAFVVGAGDGAAEGLTDLGLMRADLDGVLLADMALETIVGLPELAMASQAVGVRGGMVFGRQGVVALVDGVNLMLAGAGEMRLIAGEEGEDQGLEGQVVFDSGVVTVRAFGSGAPSAGRVHRIDFDGKSLVVSACSSRPQDIVAAARGTRLVAGIVAARSSRLGEQDGCLEIEEALKAVAQARLSAALLGPLRPSVELPGALGAWRDVVAGQGGGAVVGGIGSVLDLSDGRPVVR